MITDKLKIAFGSGDIKITGFCEYGVGGVALKQTEPYPLGFQHPVDPDNPDEIILEADVLLTFTSVQSIDILIHHLMFAKNAMLKNMEELGAYIEFKKE